MIERIALTVAEAAKAVGMTRWVIYGAIKRGELAAYQANKNSTFFVLPEELRAWVTRLRVSPQQRERDRATYEDPVDSGEAEPKPLNARDY